MEAPLTDRGPGPLSGRTILVTGSTGFIGNTLCRALTGAGASVRGTVRAPGGAVAAGVEQVLLPDLVDRPSLKRAVAGADAVVHLAARVHVMRERARDLLAEHRRINVGGTAALLEAAAEAGVRSFVFTSTVKVVGEANTAPWTESEPTAPGDPYSRSKLEAETLVREWSVRYGLHAPILRLPLVYGPGVKGNMLRLLDWVSRGVPLPFGRVANRRSLVYVGNLAAAVEAVLVAPGAARETFFVSDQDDLSTAGLVRLIGEALGRRARLLPVPPAALRLAGRAGDLVARFRPFPLTSAEIARLLDSLAVDSSKLSRLTGYRPPYGVAQGLRATAAWYLASRGRAAEC
jgi:nucleoside-diphosphate-sugar epimerase